MRLRLIALLIVTALSLPLPSAAQTTPDATLLFELTTDHQFSGARWSPDHSQILTWSINRGLDLWDATTGAHLLVFDDAEAHPSSRVVYWDQATARVLFVDSDYVIRLYDSSTGAELLALDAPAGGVNDFHGAQMSADRQRVLIWLGSTVHIWQISEASGVVSAERVLELRGARGPAQWSDDETRILTEGEIWDATTTGTLEEPLITLASNVAVCGCMWNRDNTRVIGHACPYTKDATVFVWDAATGEALLQLPHDESGYWHIYGAIWNRDETRIVSFAQDGSIQFWNAKTGDGTGNRRYNPESTGSLTSLQWSTDSTRVLMAGFTNGLQVWDAATGAPLLHIVSEELTAFSDAFWILDDRYIAAAHVPSDAVFVFDAATGDPVLHMDHPDTIHSLYWNREHTQVMVLSRDRVAVWALTGLSAP